MLFSTDESLLTNGWFWFGLSVCAIATAILFAKNKNQR